MTDTETQREPSMEEILSSIRRIISSDEEEGGDAPEAAAEAPAEASADLSQDGIDNLFDSAEEAEPEPEAQASEDLSQDGIDNLFDSPAEPEAPEEEAEPEAKAKAEDDVLELTEVVEEAPAPASVPAPEPEVEAGPAEDLVSPPTEEASVATLASLNEVITSGQVPFDVGGRTVEQLAAELMRPMLREWLDQNLPIMVERLVRAEIKRLAEASKKR